MTSWATLESVARRVSTIEEVVAVAGEAVGVGVAEVEPHSGQAVAVAEEVAVAAEVVAVKVYEGCVVEVCLPTWFVKWNFAR